MQERSDEDLYSPIVLNHIFNDDDILSFDNLDLLDQDLPS